MSPSEARAALSARRPRLVLWLGLGGLLAIGLVLAWVNYLLVAAVAFSCVDAATCPMARVYFVAFGPTATLLIGVIAGGIGGERAIRAGLPVPGWVAWPWLFYGAVFLVAVAVAF
ncbi:hypothetical protein FHR81_001185 [Actinoalloteichus hoggarensis]|uniref:Uncharacterized protein n=1 Tax=Actinoalloteichus hoggarensis TaxID=1470176 RepID=A0A221VZH4_9PSEU|nr:hypothetical protein [Actinoalloteichus hoggarensis]ASO18920.1 hypothetical protein AHOG_06340 [Actinoalloteichus hoggarensis]MBB5920155.1 hypothetical protein [Actinoalloteichus hoggarensis]